MTARLVPLLILGVLTLVLRLSTFDVAICRQFYEPTLPFPWKWGWCMPCEILYHYGLIPAWILFGTGCVVLAARARRGRFDRMAQCGLFLVLVFSVGPGLLVNLILKPGYGRPRPRDLAEFGGRHEFVPVLTPTPALRCTSFPSGHAAMGFYLMAPAFLLWKRSRIWAVLFAGSGLLLGSAIGAVRIVQGGHFPSDVVGSAGIIYLTALGALQCLRLLGTEPAVTGPPPPPPVTA